ncbi:MAG: 1-acyl-sn-glycerol-3-phosphate acyltransferase [Clostridia bacterium]|nr:1-acyl-sn-glycerol-3-phosphate acyltransferase [Clostridia bacterium]
MKENRFYYTCRALVIPLLRFLFPFRVAGVENIPSDGPAILCSNHVHMVDPLFVATSTRRYVRYISKRELFGNRFLGWFFQRLGMFPVARGGTDMSAMRTMMSILKEGGVLGIFPQGHRYPHDDNRTLESGVAVIALRARVPVIPIHVRGPVRLFRMNEIRIGEPVALDDLKRIDAPTLAEADSRLIDAIWAQEG